MHLPQRLGTPCIWIVVHSLFPPYWNFCGCCIGPAGGEPELVPILPTPLPGTRSRLSRQRLLLREAIQSVPHGCPVGLRAHAAHTGGSTRSTRCSHRRQLYELTLLTQEAASGARAAHTGGSSTSSRCSHRRQHQELTLLTQEAARRAHAAHTEAALYELTLLTQEAAPGAHAAHTGGSSTSSRSVGPRASQSSWRARAQAYCSASNTITLTRSCCRGSLCRPAGQPELMARSRTSIL